jgi:hypothetical protein
VLEDFHIRTRPPAGAENGTPVTASPHHRVSWGDGCAICPVIVACSRSGLPAATSQIGELSARMMEQGN